MHRSEEGEMKFLASVFSLAVVLFVLVGLMVYFGMAWEV